MSIGAGNQIVTFTDQTVVTATVSSSTIGIVWDCYDNNSPANAIAPTSVTVNPITYVITFNFSIAQSGYCVVNSSAYQFNGTNGFTGTKTAGSCTFTIQGGIITNVTGC